MTAWAPSDLIVAIFCALFACFFLYFVLLFTGHFDKPNDHPGRAVKPGEKDEAK